MLQSSIRMFGSAKNKVYSGSLGVLNKEALMSSIFRGIQDSFDPKISLKVTFE